MDTRSPGVLILDPHIHLWAPKTSPRTVSIAVKLFGWSDWLKRSLVPKLFPKSALRFVGKIDYVMADYLPADWARDHGDFDVRGFVHVQADWQGRGQHAAAGETRWLEQIGGPSLRAIVGEAELDDPDLPALLDAHARASPRFVGIRDILACDRDPMVMDYDHRPDRFDLPAWRAGLVELARRGLSFDAWVYGPQLRRFEAALAAVYAEAPETRVVLDHLGTPIALGGPFAGHGTNAAARERIAARWRDDLAALAEHPQLHAKISGLCMPILGWALDQRPRPPSVDEVVDRIGPLVEHALDCFGPRRCLFASNFPMDKVSLPWTTLYAAYAQLVATRSEAERLDLFHDNAARFYGLAPLAQTPAETEAKTE